MSLEKKTFAMSMFAKAEDLFRAKAEHYEREAEKLQMELEVEKARADHFEKKFYEMGDTLDRLEARLSRHEAG
jgi:hypothetical protein